MKLFTTVPVNYPLTDLFGGKIGMLTKINEGIFITMVSSYTITVSQMDWTPESSG